MAGVGDRGIGGIMGIREGGTLGNDCPTTFFKFVLGELC